MVRLIVLSITFTLLGLTSCPGARTGPTVPDVDRIAYKSGLGGQHIRYVRTDTTDPAGPHEITSGQSVDWPAWSPDGSRLAVARWDGGNATIQVVEVSVAGTVSAPTMAIGNLAPNSNDHQIAWGRNGLIAFHESGLFRDGAGAIFTVPAASPSSPPQLRAGGSNAASHPSWCSDGQLAYDLIDATGTHVVLMSRDFSSTAVLAEGSEPSCSDRYFAVVFTRGNDVIFHDYQTHVEHVVISNATQPAFGPRSTNIAFVRGGQIWICDLDGNNARAVTSGPNDGSPNWGRVSGQ